MPAIEGPVLLYTSENRLFLSGDGNEKPELTRRSGSPPKVNHLRSPLAHAKFGRRPFPRLSVILFSLQNDGTNERMTENDHITSALLTEVIIIIIIITICYR